MLLPLDNDFIQILAHVLQPQLQRTFRLGWESALQALSTSKQQQSESKNGNHSNDQDLLVKMDAR